MCSEYEERCFPDELNPDSNCGSVWVGGCPFSSEEAPCMSYYQCSEDSPDICFQSCNKWQYASDCGHYRLSPSTGEWEYEHEYCDLPYGECSEFKWDPVFEANVFVPGSCPTKCGEFYYDSLKQLCWEPCNAEMHGDCGHYVVTKDEEDEQVWTYNTKDCGDHHECVPHTYDAQYDIWVYTEGKCPAEEPSNAELIGLQDEERCFQFFYCEDSPSGVCFDPCLWQFDEVVNNDSSYYPIDFNEENDMPVEADEDNIIERKCVPNEPLHKEE